jgi:hypothetical protein
MLGSRIDKALTDNFVVRTHRALTGMAGNSGAAPPLHETLEGVGELAGYPGRRVHISYNEATNRLDAKALPVVTPLETPDGVQGCHIILDEKDLDKLPRIIQRERKKHGFPPLTEEQLATEVARFAASVEVIRKRWPAAHRAPGRQFEPAGAQCHGINSSMRSCGQPLTRRVRASVM